MCCNNIYCFYFTHIITITFVFQHFLCIFNPKVCDFFIFMLFKVSIILLKIFNTPFIKVVISCSISPQLW